MVNIIDINSKNLELLYKTKNTTITIYTFFPFRKLTKKEKQGLLKGNKSKKRNSKKYNMKCVKTKRLPLFR